MKKDINPKYVTSNRVPWNKGKTYHSVLHGGGYDAIHKWLKKHYGKAGHCAGIRCNGKSRSFQWCLLKGAKYEHKRENFIQLCSRCHRLYDQERDWTERMRMKKIGSKLSEKHKRNISIGLQRHWGHI